MQKDQLLELRGKITKSAQELALRGAGSPTERLQILLSGTGGEVSLEVLTRSYELIQEIESDDDKLSMLLDMLYEIDEKLADVDSTVDTQEATANEQHNDAFNGN